ncbi:MAG: RnfABCDGE type electron transport complex subunit G [Clostridia bacterium]|nr:RnfABCDGE type electron transport complex subunit G [Clostridia bacterium]
MQKTDNPILLAIILFIITALISLLLAFSNNITKDVIEDNLKKEQQIALNAVLEADSYAEIVSKSINTAKVVYLAKRGDETVGYCVNAIPSGFGGEIDMMVGISNDLKVTGIKIISISETPGLGSKVQETSFINQFKDKYENIKLIKNGTPKENEVVAVSGATVSSTAVKNGVNDAITAVKMLKEAENE